MIIGMLIAQLLSFAIVTLYWMKWKRNVETTSRL